MKESKRDGELGVDGEALACGYEERGPQREVEEGKASQLHRYQGCFFRR
jgi:hypothetical protein